MGTYLLLTPNQDELYHYGVKGMKWHQHKGLGNSVGGSTVGMGGGAEEISEIEQEINQAERAADSYDQMASAIEQRMKQGDKKTLFHTLVLRRGSSEARAKAERGRRKVQEIKEYAKKVGLQFQHADYTEELISVMDTTPDDLMHFGIKGMKWGIRRFQPYQKGDKVKGGKEVGAATKVKQRPSSGNIVERYKAHKTKQKRTAALKKAQATRKANSDFEAEKKKAIESGTVEDLAKFKGKLTNEEYNRAFMRLQNEKKVAEMVAVNQKSVWDKIDKGMQIVQKVGGYANTIATAKENFNKLDDAFNKRDNDAKKEKDKADKEAAKNAFMNSASYEDLVKNGSKYNLNTKEFNMVLSRLSLEKKTKAELGIDKAETDNKEKETPKDGTYEPTDYTGKKTNIKNNASYDNSNPSDFEAPKHAYEKTPKTTREKAGYVNPDGESGYGHVEKRKITGVSNAAKGKTYDINQNLKFGDSKVMKATVRTAATSERVAKARAIVAQTQAVRAQQVAQRKAEEDARAKATIASLDKKKRNPFTKKVKKRAYK